MKCLAVSHVLEHLIWREVTPNFWCVFYAKLCVLSHQLSVISRRHKKVPVPYSYYDRKALRSVKRYDPITVQIVITVVLFTP